jgi:hypothetical protein
MVKTNTSFPSYSFLEVTCRGWVFVCGQITSFGQMHSLVGAWFETPCIAAMSVTSNTILNVYFEGADPHSCHTLCPVSAGWVGAGGHLLPFQVTHPPSPPRPPANFVPFFHLPCV